MDYGCLDGGGGWEILVWRMTCKLQSTLKGHIAGCGTKTGN